MDFHYSHETNETVVDFYKPATRNSHSKITLTAITLCIFSTSANATYEAKYNLATSKAEDYKFENSIKQELSIKLPKTESEISLKIQQTADQITENKTLKRLENSFLENDLTNKEKSYFFDTFYSLAENLKTLPVESEHVSVSRQDGTITFYLYLGKKMLLTVSKPVKFALNEKDNVMFSISLDKKVIIIDQMSLKELITRVNNTIEELD